MYLTFLFLHGMLLNEMHREEPFIIPVSEFEMRQKDSHMQVAHNTKTKKPTVIINPSLVKYFCMLLIVCFQCLTSD